MKQIHIIYIPGLGDKNTINTWFLHLWEMLGVSMEVVGMDWYKSSESFTQKLERVLSRVDMAHKGGKKIVLIGASAGASAALNAYCKRKEKIVAFINICGRLKEGTHVFPSLDFAAKKSMSFKESVLLAEKNEKTLIQKDRDKMLTMRALYDEIVPVSTVSISGAKNIVVFSVEHMVSICMACSFYAKFIVDFAKNKV